MKWIFIYKGSSDSLFNLLPLFSISRFIMSQVFGIEWIRFAEYDAINAYTTRGFELALQAAYLFLHF